MMCFDFHLVSLAMRAPYLWRARSCVDVEKVQRKSVKEMAKTWVNVWYLGMFGKAKQPERLFTSKIPLHRNEMKADDSRWTWKKEFSIFNFFDSFLLLWSDELFRFRNSLHFWWLIMSRGREIPFGSCASASLDGGSNTHPMSCRDTSKMFSLLSTSCASNYSRWWYLFTLCVR